MIIHDGLKMGGGSMTECATLFHPTLFYKIYGFLQAKGCAFRVRVKSILKSLSARLLDKNSRRYLRIT